MIADHVHLPKSQVLAALTASRASIFEPGAGTFCRSSGRVISSGAHVPSSK